MKIEFSCATCKKCKVSVLDNYSCRHVRGNFFPFNRIPCEHWEPSIVDVRGWIKHAKMIEQKGESDGV